MVRGSMTELRSKFRIISESYFDFAKKELTTGQYASYSLNQSSCRFLVTFKKEELVFAEKFSGHLKNAFIAFDLGNEWIDFMQAYDNDKTDTYCTYSLYSTCLVPTNITPKGSSLKQSGLQKNRFFHFNNSIQFY